MLFPDRTPNSYESQAELQLDRLLQELGGVWNLRDLTAPSRIEIPSYETPEGKDGIQVQIPIPDDYLPKKLMDFIKRNHGPVVLEKLKTEFNFHIRSQLAQLGIDGETEKFIWSNNQLMIQIRLYSMSSRRAVIDPGQDFMSLFRVDHASHKALLKLRYEGLMTGCGRLIQFLQARPSHDYVIITKEELKSISPKITSVFKSDLHLAYALLNPIKWQRVADDPKSIVVHGGHGQNKFRVAINSQLEAFTDGTTHLVIGETVAHIKFGAGLGFNGPAFLRPEIVGFHKKTGDVLVLRQTNSLCMGHTDWPIRVEVTRVDRQLISAQELAEYDFYMFLQFYGPTATVCPN